MTYNLATKKWKSNISQLTIPGNTPSLKNSKQIVRLRNGATALIPSKTYQAWKPEAMKSILEWEHNTREWTYPIKVHFFFVRDSKRKFDYINAAQGPLDLLVEAGVIGDDDMEHVIPVFDGYRVDKSEACAILVFEEILT